MSPSSTAVSSTGFPVREATCWSDLPTKLGSSQTSIIIFSAPVSAMNSLMSWRSFGRRGVVPPFEEGRPLPDIARVDFPNSKISTTPSGDTWEADGLGDQADQPRPGKLGQELLVFVRERTVGSDLGIKVDELGVPE